MIYLALAMIIGFLLIDTHMRKIELERIEREKIFEKWMFDSLYSINHKVLLPTEHERPMNSGPAIVVDVENNPMNEFTRGLDDYFGDKNE